MWTKIQCFFGYHSTVIHRTLTDSYGEDGISSCLCCHKAWVTDSPFHFSRYDNYKPLQDWLKMVYDCTDEEIFLVKRNNGR